VVREKLERSAYSPVTVMALYYKTFKAVLSEGVGHRHPFLPCLVFAARLELTERCSFQDLILMVGS